MTQNAAVPILIKKILELLLIFIKHIKIKVDFFFCHIYKYRLSVVKQTECCEHFTKLVAHQKLEVEWKLNFI